jgi:hypothetical protein
MPSDSASSIPLLTRDTPFSSWQADAKGYLRSKKVFSACTNTSVDADVKEEALGHLWRMLGTEAKSLVKKFIDDPKAMWEALPVFFAPQKAGAIK